MTKKHIVFFTGAGMSVESGLKTFRDNDGLWEEYNVYEVATPEAWQANPKLVLEFYNKRRKQLLSVSPNTGHKAIAELQDVFDVSVITQNIDDLHERAGQKNVLHLHGELMKVRSSNNENMIYKTKGEETSIGDLAEDGSQLRPHVVWFGEGVPLLEEASKIVSNADGLVIVGTSLQVYPAAGLIHATKAHTPIYYLDPAAETVPHLPQIKLIKEKASKGIPLLAHQLVSEVGLA